MTAIIGYADGGTVWIGGDSAATDSTWKRIIIRERKVFHLGELLIGVAGRVIISQLIQYGLKLEPRDPKQLRGSEYMNMTFIPALKALLKEHNEAMYTEDAGGTGLLIGYRGNLYTVDRNLSINTIREQVFSDGAGGDLALGAFLAYRHAGKPVGDAMMLALAIAGEHNMTVGAPYYVLQTDKESDS